MPVSFRFALGVACLASLVFAPAFAQVYTWKDAKGVTHYSDSPPPKGSAKARTVTVPPAPPAQPRVVTAPEPAPASTAARPGAVQAPDPAAVQALALQRAAQCKQAQDNLAVLKASAAVAVDNDGDGKNDAVLDAEQHATQTQAMQDAVQANCVGN